MSLIIWSWIERFQLFLCDIVHVLDPVLKLCPCLRVPEMWWFLRRQGWEEWKTRLQRKKRATTLLQETIVKECECCYFRSSLSFLAVNALSMRKNSWLSSFVFICTTKPHLFISSPSFKYQNKWNEIPKTKSRAWIRSKDYCPPLWEDSNTLRILSNSLSLHFNLQIRFPHVPSDIKLHKAWAYFSSPPHLIRSRQSSGSSVRQNAKDF